MSFKIASKGKSPIYKFFDAPWKIALPSTVIALIIAVILVQLLAGHVPAHLPFVIIPCVFPIAYSIAAAFLRYQRTIDEQNRKMVTLTTELTEANKKLSHHNEDLSTLNQALDASNAELNAYAGTVAHDLKNPLSTIVNYLELSKYYWEEDDTEKAVQKVDQALNVTLQSAKTIDALLLLSNIRQEEKIQIETIEMGQIIAQVQERLNRMITEYNAQVQLPSEWPKVYGYAPWIAEVWINYLSNALKYGGQPPTVILGSDRNRQGIARFWVRDNGPGLTQSEQGLLFQEFTRLHQDRAEGHGLGLSITKRIIEKLGGKVGIESEKGHGSLFYFTLPET